MTQKDKKLISNLIHGLIAVVVGAFLWYLGYELLVIIMILSVVMLIIAKVDYEI